MYALWLTLLQDMLLNTSLVIQVHFIILFSQIITTKIVLQHYISWFLTVKVIPIVFKLLKFDYAEIAYVTVAAYHIDFISFICYSPCTIVH